PPTRSGFLGIPDIRPVVQGCTVLGGLKLVELFNNQEPPEPAAIDDPAGLNERPGKTPVFPIPPATW
ncbi:MAG: hypothetical protein PVF61_10215, partial [Gammaproteobacteria bacterium]